MPLIELFTSEGCSSCPPADRWLTRLKTNPDLWKAFTPIAFHVDYWDYIGWQDAYAQAEFGARQRRYADEGGARFVYTPGFFVKGREWNGWRTQESIRSEKNIVGILSLRISGDQIVAEFEARQEQRDQLELHVAILGMNIETHVQAGENNGKSLRHDFVALGVDTVRFDKTGTLYRATLPLPEYGAGASERAIIAWVSDNKTQRPIQSVGGFFSGS